jgi:MFS family permease
MINSKSYPLMRSWITVICTALFFFYWFVQLSLNNTLHDFYMHRFNLSSYGFFTSMYLIGNVIMFIPAGIILDKYPTKRVLIANMFVMVIGALGLLLVDTKFLAYFCMLLVGFSGAFSLLSVLRVAVKSFPADKVAFPISLSITLGMCGGLFGNSLGVLIYNFFSSGYTVQIFNIALGVLVLILIIFAVEEPEQSSDEIEPSNTVLSSLNLVVRNPQNWLAGIYISLMNLAIMILDFSFGQEYLRNIFHVAPSAAANIVSMIFIGFIVAGPISGKLSDICGYRRPIMIVGAILTIIVLSLLIFIPNLSVCSLVVIFFFIGVTTSTQSLGYPVIAESNHSSLVATANALGSLLIMGGGALAQNAFSIVQKLFDYQYAYYILPVCVIFALLTAVLMKETGWKAARIITR